MDRYLVVTTENAAGNISDFNVKVYYTGKVKDCNKKHVSLLVSSVCGLARYRQNVKMNIYTQLYKMPCVAYMECLLKRAQKYLNMHLPSELINDTFFGKTILPVFQNARLLRCQVRLTRSMRLPLPYISGRSLYVPVRLCRLAAG